jgi:hypothetical protein
METRKMSSRAMVLALTMQFMLYVSASAQSQSKVLTNPHVNMPEASDVSIPLRYMPLATPAQSHIHRAQQPKMKGLQTQWEQMGRPTFAGPSQVSGIAASSTTGAGLAGINTTPGGPIAATIGLSFDGANDVTNTFALGMAPNDCTNFIPFSLEPSDGNAAVGDTQVVEWVNLCYIVFDKSTGDVIAGPFPGNQFWSGFGRGCGTENDGDPIIQWDKLARRWVAFQNVFTYPYKTCIAISTTADATGSYFRYVFDQPFGFPDYPKVGIMPDAYYQTQNNFGPTGAQFEGVTVCAYQRAELLIGNTKKAQQVCFMDDSNGTLFDDSLLPADMDSASNPPPPGQPEVFLGSIDNRLTGGPAVYQYLMSVNWKKPSASTFTGVDGSMPITVPTYNISLCNYTDPFGRTALTTGCVNSPVPADLIANGGNCGWDASRNCSPLDTLGDRLMYRLAYFDDGSRQRWVVNHTVNEVSGPVIPAYASIATAVRWYQFTASQGSTALSVAQVGQTPDDGEYRWMGSAAMDKAGDIAIGYSRTSANVGDFPSIYYSGQAAGEPAGTTDAEAAILAGTSTSLVPPNVAPGEARWGDYTSMALDAADGCTFWYTSQYLGFFAGPAGPLYGDPTQWQTHLASLKFPTCQ